jgi:hypothetical protein
MFFNGEYSGILHRYPVPVTRPSDLFTAIWPVPGHSEKQPASFKWSPKLPVSGRYQAVLKKPASFKWSKKLPVFGR